MKYNGRGPGNGAGWLLARHSPPLSVLLVSFRVGVFIAGRVAVFV